MIEKIKIKKNDLKKYINQGLSYKEIGKIYNCSKWTIGSKAKKYNLKGKANSIGRKGIKNPVHNKGVKEKISNSVKLLWDKGIYNNRINGMLGKTKFLHPNYSPESEKIYNYREHLSQIQDIKICSLCKKTNRKIDIHHINENHLNWLFTNLEPLCVSCHQKFHTSNFIQPYVIIKKDFSMECCHRLDPYEGKCNRMHGHSYHFTIMIKKRINPDTGMVMDFGILKKIVNEYIIEELDHYNLNDKMSFKTSAENMIFWMWKQLEEKALLKGLYKITLNETDNSQAEISWKDVLEYERKLLWESNEEVKENDIN